jgi:hypothetical protein
MDLLALLNVKYVILVDRALYFNVPDAVPSEANNKANGNCPHRDIAPDQVRVVENPYPVTPREFFAGRITPADQARRPLSPGDDPRRVSIVEGIDEPRDFGAEGAIQATYMGDRIVLDVARSERDRFLVLNEMYNPRWKAYAENVEVPVFATNAVMRGLVVPSGMAHIEMRYVPSLLTSKGKAAYAAGMFAVLAILGGLKFWPGLLAIVRRFVRRFFETDRLAELLKSKGGDKRGS